MNRPTGFFLLISAASLLQACGRDGFAAVDDDQYFHKVDTQAVRLEGGYQVEREFAGLVVANQASELGFELSGRIKRLLVNEGDLVAEGQLLAELDTSLLWSQRAELNARIDSLDSEITLARRNLERVQKLQKDGLASEREWDEQNNRLLVLQASHREVSAALEANSLRLEKSKLVAPYAAKIGLRSADAGTVVDSGFPVFLLVESGARELRVGVPTNQIQQLEPGKFIPVRNGQQQVEGKILSLGATVDQATRTQTLRIAIDTAWTPGELAYAIINQDVALPGAWVPETAVTEGIRGTWAVYVAVPEGDTLATLESRSVTVHHSSHGKLFVSGALADQDAVVVHGLHRLAPRQTVRTSVADSLVQLAR